MDLADDGNYREGRWFTAWPRSAPLAACRLPAVVTRVCGQVHWGFDICLRPACVFMRVVHVYSCEICSGATHFFHKNGQRNMGFCELEFVASTGTRVPSLSFSLILSIMHARIHRSRSHARTRAPTSMRRRPRRSATRCSSSTTRAWRPRRARSSSRPTRRTFSRR